MKWCKGLILIFFLFACTGKQVPADIIQPEEMKKIIWDITRAQWLSEEVSRKDSGINKVAATMVLSKKIFEMHHITQPDFNKSYLWYTSHPEILRVMLDSLYLQNQRSNRPEPIKNPHILNLDSNRKRIKIER